MHSIKLAKRIAIKTLIIKAKALKKVEKQKYFSNFAR